MNKVLLVGRLTKDPELRKIENSEVSLSRFTLAVNTGRLIKKREKEVDFISITVWGKLAENLVKYKKKGELLSVTGKIKVRSYENKEGQRKYATEIIGEEIQFLGGKEKREEIV